MLNRVSIALTCWLFVAMTPAALGSEASELKQLFHDYNETYLQLNPETATSRGDNRYNDRLDNKISGDYLRRDEALQRDSLARLLRIDRARLDERDQVSFDTFKYNLELAIAMYQSGIAAKAVLMPIDQFRGTHQTLAQYGSGTGIQPFVTVHDHEMWLRRAAQWPAWVDQAIANMRKGIASGVVLPRPLAEKLVPQLAAMLVDKPEASVFYGPVAKIPAGPDHDRLQRGYVELIGKDIVPGYRKLHAFVVDEYLPATRTTVARTALPDGKAWYALDIRTHTTLQLTAETVHQTGLTQVALVQREFDTLRERLGFKGDLHAFFDHLRNDTSYRFADADAALTRFRDMKADVAKRVPLWFGHLPRADYEVRPVEAFRAASAAGGSYQRPNANGTRPGVFYLNTYDLSRLPTYEVVSLSLHEAVPGHHFQIALATESTQLPDFQRFGFITAFGEGWALYAETLGKEMGFYDDPVQYLGYLHNRLFRANRLVVDTGMHALGWSREQAIQWLLDNSEISPADATAEVERYIAWPGQALAYMTGALKIQELRDRASQQLGERFDIRAFHDEVLDDGLIPLPVLEGKIQRWLAARQR